MAQHATLILYKPLSPSTIRSKILPHQPPQLPRLNLQPIQKLRHKSIVTILRLHPHIPLLTDRNIHGPIYTIKLTLWTPQLADLNFLTSSCTGRRIISPCLPRIVSLELHIIVLEYNCDIVPELQAEFRSGVC